MASIKHATQATKPQRNDKEVSRNAWNEDHAITGTPDTILSFDGTGAATDLPLSSVGGLKEASTRAVVQGETTSNGKAILLKEAGREGIFVFSNTNLSTLVTADTTKALFIAPNSDPTGASGAWVRKFSFIVNIQWFGATGDGVTVDYPAFLAAHNLIGAMAQTGFGYNVGTLALYAPKGVYNFAGNPWDFEYPIHIMGDGSGSGSNAATVFKWNNTSSGIRVQFIDTSGDTGTKAPVAHSGQGSILEGIHFEGGYTNGDEAERHGIIVRAICTIRDCHFFNWAGDGVHVYASTAGVMKGNANNVSIDTIFVQNCRDGVSFTGNDDVNACNVRNVSAVANRQWGVNDRSFLGNQHFGGHFDANARNAWNTGLANRPCSYVTHGGHMYFCVDGQEAWASVNAPSGTTADNQGWGYWQSGAPAPSTGMPAWFNGINVRAGGPIRVWGLNNASTIAAPHIEINGVSQFDQYATVLGASTADAVLVSNNTLSRNRLGRLRANNLGIRADGNLTVSGALYAGANTNFMGPSSGSTVVDGITVLGTRNVSHTLEAQTFDAAGNPSATYASYGFYNSLGTISNVSTGLAHRIRVNFADIVMITGTGAAVTGTLSATGAITGSNLSGTNTGDQTITLTGDVTGSGTGSFATTVVQANLKPKESLIIACSDETTALAAGTNKVTFRMPYAFTLSAIRGSLSTAQTSGAIFTVDVNEGGASILSTKLTIDNTEKTSTTAATPLVISDTALADDAEITIDIDQIGDGTAKGLKITLIGNRT